LVRDLWFVFTQETGGVYGVNIPLCTRYTGGLLDLFTW